MNLFNTLCCKILSKKSALLSDVLVPWNILIFKICGASIGKNCKIKGKVIIKIGSKCHVCIGNSFRSNNGSTVNGLNRNLRGTFWIMPDAKLSIGNSVGMSSCALIVSNEVVIANNVMIGAGTIIMDTDGHSLYALDRNSRESDHNNVNKKSIYINENVFIGTNSIILKGSVIGRGSIVGAGSIIRGKVPPYSISMGNPAKVVGFIMTPKEVFEHEKTLYPEKERLSLESLEKNYDRYFISRLKEIKSYTKL